MLALTNIPDNCGRVKHAIVSGVRIVTELRVTVLVPFSRESPIYYFRLYG